MASCWSVSYTHLDVYKRQALAYLLFRWDSHHTARRLPVAVALLALAPYVIGLLVFGR